MKKILLLLMIPILLSSCNSETTNTDPVSSVKNECLSSKYKNFHEKLKNWTYSDVCNWKNVFIKDYKEWFRYDAEDLYYLTKTDKDYALSLYKESFDFMDRYWKFLSINVFKEIYWMSENEINSTFYGNNYSYKFTFLDEDISAEDFIVGTFNQIFTLSYKDDIKPLLTDKELRVLSFEFKYKEMSFPSGVARINEPIKKWRINKENKELFIKMLKTSIKNQNNDYFLLSQSITTLKELNSLDEIDKEILKSRVLLESLDFTWNSRYVDLINDIALFDKNYAKILANNFYETYSQQKQINPFTISKDELKRIKDKYN